MLLMLDLKISGGRIVDGSGAAPFVGDVAVQDGVIVAVGPSIDGEAIETIDATGRIVTPGFVDIHCHYDGQATWDPLLEPSSLHGITTVVVGNCGVGFAPVAVDQRDWLIELMEGVEDIPGTALSEGITWGWESFPEYLDVLASMPRSIDVGALVPHGALRTYVMGERGATDAPASAEDIARMGALAAEAVAAGALGFSTNRLEGHRSKSGVPVPGTYADEAELAGIIGALGRARQATIEWAAAGNLAGGIGQTAGGQFSMMRRIAEASGNRMLFTINEVHGNPDHWRRQLDKVAAMAADGVAAFPQVHGRGFCLLMGFDTTLHPFRVAPSWQPLAALPFAERIERLADPQVRATLIGETTAIGDLTNGFLQYGMVFSMGDPPNYEPSADESMAAIAAAEGRPVLEVVYDRMLANEGRNLLSLQIINYAHANLESSREMLEHPLTVLGGSDGGAHCATASDASMPSFMLSYWVRDRAVGRLPLEMVVHKMTGATAEVYGLDDRGVIAVGKKADLNVIDLNSLQVQLPEMRYDLPAGGKRLVQSATGYVATIVSGTVVRRDGADTGARPGRLVRSA